MKSIESKLQFSGGELSPMMDARVDHPKYSTGCRQLQNMIALRQGAATRRPGFLFKALAKFSNTDIWIYATRLMSFQYSPTTSFILEIGHHYIRFYSGQQQVHVTDAPVWDAGATYVAGNYARDPGDGNAIYYAFANVGPSVQQPHDDPNHWVKQTILEVPTPYEGRVPYGGDLYACDVWRLAQCQINDVVYLVHPNYPVYSLTRYADTDWRMKRVEFNVPAMLDQNVSGVRMTPSGTVGAVTLNANADAWAAARYYSVGEAVNPGGQLFVCVQAHQSGATFADDKALGYWEEQFPFTASNVGGYFRVGYLRDTSNVEIALTADGTSAEIEAVGSCEFNTYGTWAADATLERSDDNGLNWYSYRKISSRSDHNGSIPVNLSQPARFRIQVTNYTASTGTPVARFIIVSGIQWGLLKVTAYTNPYLVTCQVMTRLYATTPTTYWAEGAWSERRGYPQAVTAFQQRVIYGGSDYEPQRIWGTVTNDIENFDRGDSSKSTDSFAFDIAAVGRGRIVWLIGQVDLFIGFAAAEWIANAGQGSFGGSNEPITPTQINAGEHSSFGSAEGIPPQLVGNAVIYTQRSARTIQQMLFSVYTNKYQSSDLTALSEHLFGSGIVQFAYQPQFRNQAIVWVVNRSGGLCGMSIDQQFEVYGWHRQVSEYSLRVGIAPITSVAAVLGEGASDDQVWVVVDRPAGRAIEMMNPENWEYAGSPVKGIAQPSPRDAIYVDSALTATPGAYGWPLSNVLPGFNHLVLDDGVTPRGAEVMVLINGGIAVGPIEVAADGTVTIEGYEPQAGDVLQIGLPINYVMEPMRLDADGRVGVTIGIQKALSRVFLRLMNSLSGKVQGNGEKLVAITYRTQANPIGALNLYTGDKEVTIESTQTLDPKLIVRGNDPFPLTILATTVRIGITGSA